MTTIASTLTGFQTTYTDATVKISTESVTTSGYIAVSNATTTTDDKVPKVLDVWQLLLVSLLIVTDILTFLGNLLVLLAFVFEKKLRRIHFNLFILNLSVTDLAVSLTAIPFYIIDFMLGYWPFDEYLCAFWIFCDWGLTFASIFTLVAISVDRYWASCYSVQYRKHNSRKRTLIFIIVVWLVLLAVWFPPFIIDRIRWSEAGTCLWAVKNNREFVIFVTIAGYHGPSAVMIFCYIRVFLIVRKSRMAVSSKQLSVPKTNTTITKQPVTASTSCQETEKNNYGKDTKADGVVKTNNVEGTVTEEISTVADAPRATEGTENQTTTERLKYNDVAPAPAKNPNQAVNPSKNLASTKNKSTMLSRDQKIFISLSYIIIAYLIFWTPFHVVFDVLYFDENAVSTNWYTFASWMCYLNSTLNPILYACANKEFREAFKKILTLQCLSN